MAANRLRHRWWLLDEGWSDWHDLHAVSLPLPTTSLAAASWGDDHMEVFALARDSCVWHLWWNPDGSWHHEWQRLNDDRVDGPVTAASLKKGHVELYATANDVAVSIYRDDEETWSAWQHLG